MSDLAHLKIWGDPAIREGLLGTWTWRRTGGRLNFVLRRRLLHRSTP